MKNQKDIVTEFLPFKGIVYNSQKVKGSDVLAPPYDIISPDKQDELYEKSKYNIVRVDFGKELPDDNKSNNKYARASRYLAEWLSDGVLKKRDREAFYVYEAEYRYMGRQLKLRGVVGNLKLVDLGKGVYPHEETHSAPKRDRLELMRVCKSNISPIFSLYHSPERQASEIISDTANREPYMEAVDEWGVTHRIWIVHNSAALEGISSDISGKAVYIADGHHRYETALIYQEEMRRLMGNDENAPYNYVMMFLVNIADEGITILPTHRLINKVPDRAVDLLKKSFEVIPLEDDKEIIATLSQYERAIGMYLHGDKRFYVLKQARVDLENVHSVLRELDVIVLHEFIFKKLFDIDIITYEMDPYKCIHLITSGEYGAVFFLNPTMVKDIERVSLHSLRMPPKSTYFYPKLLTGFVMNPFE